MQIYSAMVFLDSGDGMVLKVDAIEHAGHFWLVPQWIDSLDGSPATPAYMIQIDSIPHQKQLGIPPGDFSIAVPIPKSVFEGRGTAPGFVVSVLPDIHGKSQGQAH